MSRLDRGAFTGRGDLSLKGALVSLDVVVDGLAVRMVVGEGCMNFGKRKLRIVVLDDGCRASAKVRQYGYVLHTYSMPGNPRPAVQKSWRLNDECADVNCGTHTSSVPNGKGPAAQMARSLRQRVIQAVCWASCVLGRAASP